MQHQCYVDPQGGRRRWDGEVGVAPEVVTALQSLWLDTIEGDYMYFDVDKVLDTARLLLVAGADWADYENLHEDDEYDEDDEGLAQEYVTERSAICLQRMLHARLRGGVSRRADSGHNAVFCCAAPSPTITATGTPLATSLPARTHFMVGTVWKEDVFPKQYVLVARRIIDFN
eukprot:COSAG04_NODE_4446_length_2087_cov_1.810865_3_plen_173_part_00